jgi:hypothetical protein
MRQRKRKNYEDIKKDLIKNYKSNATHFAKKYGESVNYITSLASKFKLTNPKKFNDNFKQQISDRYLNGETIVKLSKELNMAERTISKLLKEKGVRIRTRSEVLRKFYFNEDYFEKIDCPQKAYWLGFLYADGCMYKNKNKIKIALQEADGYLIEEFFKDLESNQKPCYDKSRRCKETQITSSKMCEDLKNKGMRPRKTYDLDFPKIDEFIPKKYFDNFLIGFFDGDGSVKLNRHKIKGSRYRHVFLFGAVGFKYFIEELSIYFEEQYGIKSTVYAVKANKKGLIYKMYLKKNREDYEKISSFFKNGYNGLNHFLTRKKEVVDLYFKNQGYIPPKNYN